MSLVFLVDPFHGKSPIPNHYMIHEGHEGPLSRRKKCGFFLVSLVSSLRSRIAIIWDAGYYGGGGFLVDPFLGIGVNRYERFRDPRRARRATKPEKKMWLFLSVLSVQPS